MRTKILYSSLAALITLSTMSCTESASEEEQLKQVVDALPWMLELMQQCEAYKQVKMDADKRDVAKAAQRLVRSAEVKEARAIVEKSVPPTEGGASTHYLQLKLSDKVRFASHSTKRPLDETSAIFGQLSSLGERQCVIFSAKDLEPISTSERGASCDPRYYVNFTKIRACP